MEGLERAAAKATIQSVMDQRSWCQWWPGLEPVEYGFRFALTVIQRKPVRRVVSSCDRYCSEAEVLRAIDLLGRAGYDFIRGCRSYLQLDLVIDPEERTEFQAAFNRLARDPESRQALR
jgi:hypothetical protein